MVPRRGLEPPRSYPLVPETSASTNSATWAFRVYFLRCCTRRLASKQETLVPRRGLEPPRSYPLVPETSASTNSATWASQEATILSRIFRIFDGTEKSLKISCGAVRCGAVRCGAVRCGAVRCGAVRRLAAGQLLPWTGVPAVSRNESVAKTKNPADREICRVSCMVPRRGLEPPRSYPLVPETSASTNSATWAFRVCFLRYAQSAANECYSLWCPGEDSNLHGVTR